MGNDIAYILLIALAFYTLFGAIIDHYYGEGE